MSRPIKFRVWFENTKEMTPPFIGKIKYDGCLYSLDDFFNDDYRDAVAVEQFTGLPDKNKKEIYEGDIVEENGFAGINRVVKFGSYDNKRDDEKQVSGYGWFMERIGKGPDYSSVFALIGGEDIEIIGNIHENADLLK